MSYQGQFIQAFKSYLNQYIRQFYIRVFRKGFPEYQKEADPEITFRSAIDQLMYLPGFYFEEWYYRIPVKNTKRLYTEIEKAGELLKEVIYGEICREEAATDADRLRIVYMTYGCQFSSEGRYTHYSDIRPIKIILRLIKDFFKFPVRLPLLQRWRIAQALIRLNEKFEDIVNTVKELHELARKLSTGRSLLACSEHTEYIDLFDADFRGIAINMHKYGFDFEWDGDSYEYKSVKVVPNSAIWAFGIHFDRFMPRS
jgi:hypothetical protein